MAEPPVFGGDCVTVERFTDESTDLYPDWTTYIDYTHVQQIPAGWYFASWSLYFKTIDGGVNDWGEYQVRIEPGGIQVACTERALTDQGIAAEDPNCNLAPIAVVQIPAPIVPRIIVEFRANPAVSPVVISTARVELWWLRSL